MNAHTTLGWITLWVRGYVLCGGCEKGVHTDCQKPCMCDICEETP